MPKARSTRTRQVLHEFYIGHLGLRALAEIGIAVFFLAYPVRQFLCEISRYGYLAHAEKLVVFFVSKRTFSKQNTYCRKGLPRAGPWPSS